MTQNTTDTSRRRYEFNTRLGVGGFGEVYRATMHTGAVHMDVAVKLLRPEYGQDEQAGLRLRDEARFLSALRHPSIIRIFDLVKLHGRLALVTEFADGEDLKRVLEREDPLPPRAAAEILARVADALHAASTSLAPGSSSPMKLIHRDIKPGNIHLGSHGGVTLLDFGIARTDAVGRQARTAAYAIVGSGEYTPPEILMREPATEASDIWSLGVTIFEALSGTSLFEDPDMRSMARLFVKGQPRALIESRIGALDAPPALHQLLLDMLEIDPEDRPAATDVMRRADDLVDNLDGLSLRRWAQQRTWLPPAAEPGALEGSTLIEEPLDATASQMPKATPPFAPQRGSFDAVDHDDEDVEDEETEETFSPASPVATVSFPSDFEDSDDEARTVVHDPNAPQFDDEAAVVDDDPTLPKPPRTQPEDESEAVLVPPPAPARTQQSQGRGWWLAALLLVLIFGGLVGVTGLAGSGLLLMAPGTSSTEVVEPPENPGAAAVDTPEPGTAPERNDEAEPGEPAGEPVADDTPELDASDAAGADDQPDGGTETEDLPEAAAAPKPTEAPAPAVAPAPTAAPPTAPAPRPAPSPAPQPSQAPPPAPAPAPTYSTRPEAMDYAKLTFNANVKAEVYVDGKLEGTTPVTVTLTPGRHEFYAMIPGYPQTKTGGPINLVAGSNQQLNLTFQKN